MTNVGKDVALTRNVAKTCAEAYNVLMQSRLEGIVIGQIGEVARIVESLSQLVQSLSAGSLVVSYSDLDEEEGEAV